MMDKKQNTKRPEAAHAGIKFFSAIGRFSVRFRWFVVIFWIALIPIVTANFPNINEVSKNNNSDFLPKNSPTDTAVKMESKFQSKDTAANAIIVAARSNGALTDADQRAITKVQEAVKKSGSVTDVKDQGISADGQAEQISVGINGDAFGEEALKIADDLRSKMKSVEVPAGLELHLTGDFAASVDAANANQQGRKLFNVSY